LRRKKFRMKNTRRKKTSPPQHFTSAGRRDAELAAAQRWVAFEKDERRRHGKVENLRDNGVTVFLNLTGLTCIEFLVVSTRFPRLAHVSVW
jgi:hypothetical protein